MIWRNTTTAPKKDLKQHQSDACMQVQLLYGKQKKESLMPATSGEKRKDVKIIAKRKHSID